MSSTLSFNLKKLLNLTELPLNVLIYDCFDKCFFKTSFYFTLFLAPSAPRNVRLLGVTDTTIQVKHSFKQLFFLKYIWYVWIIFYWINRLKSYKQLWQYFKQINKMIKYDDDRFLGGSLPVLTVCFKATGSTSCTRTSPPSRLSETTSRPW